MKTDFEILKGYIIDNHDEYRRFKKSHIVSYLDTIGRTTGEVYIYSAFNFFNETEPDIEAIEQVNQCDIYYSIFVNSNKEIIEQIGYTYYYNDDFEIDIKMEQSYSKDNFSIQAFLFDFKEELKDAISAYTLEGMTEEELEEYIVNTIQYRPLEVFIEHLEKGIYKARLEDTLEARKDLAKHINKKAISKV